MELFVSVLQYFFEILQNSCISILSNYWNQSRTYQNGKLFNSYYAGRNGIHEKTNTYCYQINL